MRRIWEPLVFLHVSPLRRRSIIYSPWPITRHTDPARPSTRWEHGEIDGKHGEIKKGKGVLTALNIRCESLDRNFMKSRYNTQSESTLFFFFTFLFKRLLFFFTGIRLLSNDPICNRYHNRAGHLEHIMRVIPRKRT